MPTWRDLPRFWWTQRVVGFDTPTRPHMDSETIALLEEMLPKARFYVEYGAGGSTILADRLGVRTVSVESDRYYAAAVRKGFIGASAVILTPDIGVTGPWGYPIFRKRTRARLERWRRYLDAPFAFGIPDLVLVDGRFRVACALESARRIVAAGKKATLIIDDYARRKRYHSVEAVLGEPNMVGRAAVFAIRDQMVPPVTIESVR